jgi:hypothetical protein
MHVAIINSKMEERHIKPKRKVSVFSSSKCGHNVILIITVMFRAQPHLWLENMLKRNRRWYLSSLSISTLPGSNFCVSKWASHACFYSLSSMWAFAQLGCIIRHLHQTEHLHHHPWAIYKCSCLRTELQLVHESMLKHHINNIIIPKLTNNARKLYFNS